ncbi:MAG: DUF126 domain-containing protein [Chloroflexota bacterium]|nr:DUF126 domain-containing protein [Chloroflexota bacterium]
MGHIVTFQTQTVLSGEVFGEALAADAPLSFWGGIDPDTGEIIDRRHPLSGSNVAGRVLVIPFGRGSCSGSGILLESIRNGTAPVAIVTSHIDQIISLGAILGDELYGTYPVVLVMAKEDRLQISSGDMVAIGANGLARITPAGGV